ncbi:MAG: hypothetical protein K2M44_01235 [Clostridia bacterium]|nr:hypothetical protein [Clostridia bacterium]
MAREYIDDNIEDAEVEREEDEQSLDAIDSELSDEESDEKRFEPDANYDGDDENAPPATTKKKHCCLTCLITVLIITVVFVAAMLGGSYFAWDHYIGKESGVNLFQATTLMRRAFKSDDSRVDNRYTQDDLDGFYNQLLDALCMKVPEGYQWDLGKMVVSYIKGDGSSEEAQALLAAANAESGSVNTTGNEALDDLLNSLSFDWDAIKSEGDKGVLQVNGKQLGAFIGDALKSVLSDTEVLGLRADLSDCVFIEQINIKGNEIVNNASTVLTVTIRIMPKHIVEVCADNYLEQLPSIAKKLIRSIVPKSMYLTADLRPCDESGNAMLYFNGLDDEQMNKIFSVVDAVIKLTGAETSVKDGLLRQVNETVCKSIASLREIVPVNFVADGLNTLPVDFMLGALKVDLSAAQFFEVVRYISSPDHYYTQSMIDEFKYVNYDAEAEQLVITVKGNYGLSKADEINADNLYSSLKGMFDGNSAVIDKIDMVSVMTDDKIVWDGYVPLTYGGFAGLVRGYMDDNVEQNGGMVFKLCSLEYDADMSGARGGRYVQLRIELDIKQTLRNMNIDIADNGVYSNLINQIIPSKTYVSAFADLSAMVSGQDMAVAFEFNDCGDNTEQILDNLVKLLSSLGVSGESLESLSYQGMQKRVADAVAGINQGGSVNMIKAIDEEYIYIDNVYSLLYNYAYVDKAQEQGKEPITLQRFSIALQSLYRFDSSVSSEGDAPTGISSATYMGKDYVPAAGEDSWSLDVSNPSATMSVTDRVIGNVLVARERQTAGNTDADAKSLAKEMGLTGDIIYGQSYWIEQVCIVTPLSVEGQRLISYYEDAISSFNPRYDKTKDSYLVVTIAVDLDAFTGVKSTAKLLPDYVYLTVFMNVTDGQRYYGAGGTIANPNAYELEIIINNIDMLTQSDLFEIVVTIDADVAQNLFSEEKMTQLRNNLHRFMIEFALYKSDDALMPDICIGEILDASKPECVPSGESGIGMLTFKVSDLLAIIRP